LKPLLRLSHVPVLVLAWVPVALAVALLTPGEPVYSQAAQRPAARPAWPPKLEEPAPGEVEVLPVRGNVHVIIGAGGNVTVQTGEQGILLVDTGSASMSEKVWAAVQKIAPPRKALRYVINTSENPEHTGGNAVIAAKGQTVPLREANYTAGPQGTINYNRASVVSHQNVLNRMSAPTGQKSPTPPEAWPDNTYAIDQKRFYFNDEPVVMMNSIVFFRKSDVISTGDLVDLTRYPLIDIKAGGSIQAIVASLNRLIDLCVPESHGAGGTLIVPGHGRIADHAEVAYYRDMTYIIRDRVQDMISKGMTLAQVKAAKPTRDWDTRYGSSTGGWTTDGFVEAVFTNLSASGKK